MPSPGSLMMDEEWSVDTQSLLWHYFTVNEALVKAKVEAGNASSMTDASRRIIDVRVLTQKLQQLGEEIEKRR